MYVASLNLTSFYLQLANAEQPEEIQHSSPLPPPNLPFCQPQLQGKILDNPIVVGSLGPEIEGAFMVLMGGKATGGGAASASTASTSSKASPPKKAKAKAAPAAPIADPERLSVPQLKEALTKLRVRSNHCVEKSELVALYRLHASGSTLPAAAGTMPTRPTPHSNSAPAASPAAAAAAPASRSASSGGGTYVNGRYVPAGGAGGAGSLLGVSWQTIAIGVFAAVYM